MSHCWSCGGIRIEFVYGMLMHEPEALDALRVVTMGCVMDPQVAGHMLGAWCGGCQRMYELQTDEPIEWDAAWGAPTDFIPAVHDPVGLVEELIGDVGDPVDDVLLAAELARARGDRVLELYASQRAAGRASRNLADVDPVPLWLRTRELLDELSESERDGLIRDGTLASILAEVARYAPFPDDAGEGEGELEDWRRALAAVEAAESCDEAAEIRADAAQAFHDRGYDDVALELATSVADHVGSFEAAATAGVIASIHAEQGRPAEALTWGLRQARAELYEPDLWMVTIGTRDAIERAVGALREDPESRRRAVRELRRFFAALTLDNDGWEDARRWVADLLGRLDDGRR